MEEIKTQAVPENLHVSASPSPMRNHYVAPVSAPQQHQYPQDRPQQGAKIEVARFDNKERQMIELEKCIRRLKKKCEKDNILKELKERQYYKKPSEVRREKAKNARRLMEKNRKKAEAYANGNGYHHSKWRKESANGPRPGTGPVRPATKAPEAQH